VSEWRSFLEAQVTEVSRTDHGARFRLRDRDQSVLRAVDLSGREKACCPFFDFRLRIERDGVWLDVQAPEEAGPLIDGMVGLVAPG
jgi:hypothetical protein